MEGLVPSTFHRVFLFDGRWYISKFGGSGPEQVNPTINGPINYSTLFTDLATRFRGNTPYYMSPILRKHDIVPIKYENGHVMLAFAPSTFNESSVRVREDNPLGLKTVKGAIEMPEETQWFYVDELEIYDKSSDGITKAGDAVTVFENYHTIGPGPTGGFNPRESLPEGFNNLMSLLEYSFYTGIPHTLKGNFGSHGRNDSSNPPVTRKINTYVDNPHSSDDVQQHLRSMWSYGYPNLFPILHTRWNYPITIHGLIPDQLPTGVHSSVLAYSEFETTDRFTSKPGQHSNDMLERAVYDGNRIIVMETDLTNTIQFFSRYNGQTMNAIDYHTLQRGAGIAMGEQPTNGGALAYIRLVEDVGRFQESTSTRLFPTLSRTGRLSLYTSTQPHIEVVTPMNLGVDYKARNKNYNRVLLASSVVKAFIEIKFMGAMTIKNATVGTIDTIVKQDNNIIKNGLGYVSDGLEIATVKAIEKQLEYSYTDETSFTERVRQNDFRNTTDEFMSNNKETRKLILPQTQSLITESGEEFKNRRPFVKLPVNKLFKSIKEFNKYIDETFGGEIGKGDNFIKVKLKPWVKSEYDYVWKLWSQGIFDSGNRTSKGRSLNDTDRRFTTN